MAGHSKWAQIKRAKAVTDTARARVFSRFARLIALESKKVGGSVTAPSLAAVIARAKAANMPKDNIERAVAKGASKNAGELFQVLYEAYGPGGTALLIDALTDNKNRTTQEIKHLLSLHGIELAAPGAASWAFAKTPDGSYVPSSTSVELSEADDEKLGALLDALDDHDDVQKVYTNARDYEDAAE